MTGTTPGGKKAAALSLQTDALKELSDATERFPSLFSFTPDAIALYGPDGTSIASNAVARMLVGDPRGELIGQHFSRHTGSADRDRIEAFFQTALSGKPIEFETIFVGLDGRTIDVMARLVPALIGSAIVGVFGIARDLTALRSAEASRDKSRQEFRSLFDQHPDPISMIDEDLRYVRINQAAQRMLGYSSAELEGKTTISFGAEGRRDVLKASVLELTRAGKPARYRTTVICKDGALVAVEGTAVPIVVDGEPAGLFLITHDITDRERLQNALAIQTRRMLGLYRLASEMGADPSAQVNRTLAFAAKELGFESAFIATLQGEALRLEFRVGTEPVVAAADPLLGALFRETIAGSSVLDVDGKSLQGRAAKAGETDGLLQSFVAAPLDVQSARYGALCFAGRTARAALDEFDHAFVVAVVELTAVSIERAKREERLVGLAHFDALTGLPNRYLFRDRFARAVALAERRRESFAVHFIDMDRLKAVNDTRGHAAGDHALQIVAERLRRACRERDTVARIGGDEFVVLQPGPLLEKDSETLAARMLAGVSAPCELDGVGIDLSVSIGISLFPQDGRDEQTLLATADAALYAAKAAGKGKIQRYGARP